MVKEFIYILSSFTLVVVPLTFWSSPNPLNVSGLILWNAKIMSFLKFKERLSGHFTEIIIFVSECSIMQIGKVKFFNFSLSTSSLLPKFLLFFILRFKYLFKSQSFIFPVKSWHILFIVMTVQYFLE